MLNEMYFKCVLKGYIAKIRGKNIHSEGLEEKFRYCEKKIKELNKLFDYFDCPCCYQRIDKENLKKTIIGIRNRKKILEITIHICKIAINDLKHNRFPKPITNDSYNSITKEELLYYFPQKVR